MSSNTLTLRFGNTQTPETKNNDSVQNQDSQSNNPNLNSESSVNHGSNTQSETSFSRRLISRRQSNNGSNIVNPVPTQSVASTTTSAQSFSNNQASINNSYNDDEEDLPNREQLEIDSKKILELKSLKTKSAENLIQIAKQNGLENVSDFGRQDIIYHILKNFSDQSPDNVIIGEGVLEVLEDGFGFLRAPETNYFPGSDDIYVSPSQIKRFALRTGDTVRG